jgi:hypothetical protein
LGPTQIDVGNIGVRHARLAVDINPFTFTGGHGNMVDVNIFKLSFSTAGIGAVVRAIPEKRPVLNIFDG